MVWSFIWRWVLASVVMCPLVLFSSGFVVGVLFGDGPNTFGVPVFFVTLAACAAWAVTSARRAR